MLTQGCLTDPQSLSNPFSHFLVCRVVSCRAQIWVLLALVTPHQTKENKILKHHPSAVRKKAVRDELCKAPSLLRAMPKLQELTPSHDTTPSFTSWQRSRRFWQSWERQVCLLPAVPGMGHTSGSRGGASPMPQGRGCYCLGLCTAHTEQQLPTVWSLGWVSSPDPHLQQV